MMRRLDLLPALYAQRRKEARRLATVVVAGVAVVAILGGWFFMLGAQIGAAESELADVRAGNNRLEARIAELQRFALLEQELLAKQDALRTVMTGDVAWPSLLTEIAMVVPSEVWLTKVTGSAAGVEGEVPVETETAPVRISSRVPYGRVQVEGSSLNMPGVAKWLLRLASVREFYAVFLNNAVEEEVDGADAINFDSTLELKKAAASNRYARGMP